jgi:hypothetical protein
MVRKNIGLHPICDCYDILLRPQSIIYFAYALIPNLDDLLQYSAIGVQLKIAIALISQLVLKRTQPNAKRKISVCDFCAQCEYR